jgi:DNA-binding NarL/FixJ family response regulator
MPLRILIVDDFEKFRRYLCSALEQDRRFEIAGQACDGMEAIQKAAELQPDLVLLDVGLPKLNGIQAAKQMRKVAPLAKILFISQEFSFDVVKAALRSGALGYIQKLNVARELSPGIEAVLEGRYFIRGTVKEKFRETNSSHLRHELQIYSDDAALVEGFADFTATELSVGKAAIVVATTSHLAGILQRLKARNVDVEHAIETGILFPRDAVETLSKFMIDGKLDPEHFFDAMEALVAESTRMIPRVAVRRDRPPVVCGRRTPPGITPGTALGHCRSWLRSGYLVRVCSERLGEGRRDFSPHLCRALSRSFAVARASHSRRGFHWNRHSVQEGDI